LLWVARTAQAGRYGGDAGTWRDAELLSGSSTSNDYALYLSVIEGLKGKKK
jgi:hypothetical protein